MTELPPAPSAAFSLPPMREGWFYYSVQVYPQHTDYAGVVWHGSYLGWMEAARVEYLRAAGVDFEKLVAAGMDLPVVNLALRYHRAARMGDFLDVKTRLAASERMRLEFEYEIRTKADLCVTASVTLVPVDMQRGKILRELPPVVSDAIARLKSL